MQYGRKYEETARQQVAAELNVTIDQCGLFIDRDHPFLGASPDGTIDEDGLVEIKCPSSAKELTPDEAILQRKFTFWGINKKSKEIVGLNQNHNFYYQVQGQLHVTRRDYCLFVLWTPKGLKVEKIKRDDAFWSSKMFPSLEKFYINCLLPELIDPRVCRSMPIRNPTYILEAQKSFVERKKQNKNEAENKIQSVCESV